MSDSQNQLQLDLEQFRRDGFLKLAGLFSADALADFESCIAWLYEQQFKKIGDYVYIESTPDRSTLKHVLNQLEADDKEALYQVQKFLPSSQSLRALFNREFIGLCAELIGAKPHELLLDGPALFVNRPKTLRLLYKWHSEAHYYPKRRRFLNVWLPLFTPRDQYNGAMQFKVGSHTRDFPFAEYTGYDKNSRDKKNHFVQYEIPESFLTDYPDYVCESTPGDCFLFDRALVHRSNENRTGDYSFAVVARVWTPCDDLTLSGRMEATPYGGDFGRSNLRVATLYEQTQTLSVQTMNDGAAA